MEISAIPILSALADASHPAQKLDAHSLALRNAVASLESGPIAGLIQTETALLRTLLQTLQATPGTRGQIAPLLADLAKAQASPATPAAIKDEIAQTLDTAQSLRNLTDDADITRVLLESRPRTEAAAGARPAPSSTAQPALLGELKTALTTLQGALQQWVANEGMPPTAANATTAAQAPRQAPSLSAAVTGSGTGDPRPVFSNALSFQPLVTSADLVAAQKAPPGQTGLPPPLVMPLGSMAHLPTQAATASSSAHGGMADAMVSFLLSQQAAATPSDAMTRLRNAKLANPADGKSDLSPDTTNPAVAAYRKALPPTPMQQATLWPHEPGPAFIARTLSSRTEAALTQVKILEITAQLQRAEQSTANASAAPEPRWMFNLPLQTPFGQAQARFEVSRDSFKSGKGALAVVWRTRLSMDVEPLGPVHAQIALLGKHAWIGLWAERAETMNLLEQQQALLQHTFSADDVEAEVICCLGAPPAHAAGTGTMWDNAV